MPGPFGRLASRLAQERPCRASGLNRGRGFAALPDPVNSPQQARGGTSPGRPGVGHRAQIARRGPSVKREGQARGLLQGEVGAGEDIRVACREQEVDLGGPGADALYAAKGWDGFLGTFAFERGQIEPAGEGRLLDRPQGADFGRGKTGGPEHIVARRRQAFRP